MTARLPAAAVSIEDFRLGDRPRIAVVTDCALDAFNHPFAYAG